MGTWIADYSTHTGRNIEELSSQQRQAVRAHQAVKLKALLQQELSKLEAARLDSTLDRAGLSDRERRTNRDWASELDNMLLQGVGFGLATYMPRQRLKALPAGHIRCFVDNPGPGGVVVRRSVIQSPDGQRVFEVPRLRFGINGGVDGQGFSPTLHLCIDQGSVGLPASLWVMLGQGLWMTLTFDIFHRLHNDCSRLRWPTGSPDNADCNLIDSCVQHSGFGTTCHASKEARLRKSTLHDQPHDMLPTLSGCCGPPRQYQWLWARSSTS